MAEKNTVELDTLLGEHELDAVDTFIERVKDYGEHFQDAEAIRFRLDGKTYTAIEDPSDGYRSYLGELFVADHDMRNVFPPIKVVARKRAHEQYSNNDTLEFVDAVTGKVVLEVGTDNFDDYYPCFVSAFHPENMASNAPALMGRD